MRNVRTLCLYKGRKTERWPTASLMYRTENVTCGICMHVNYFKTALIGIAQKKVL
jgi:hypothetical protein